MHKLTVMTVLVAIILLAPTVRVFGCDTDNIADCVRSILKVPPIRQVVPTVPRPPALPKAECDANDEDDVKACLRGFKVPGVGRLSEPDPRPAAAAPAERKPAEKSEVASSSSIAASKPALSPELAARVQPDSTPERCQKYFPAVGQLVHVPCGE